jgi:hypothetical protein
MFQQTRNGRNRHRAARVYENFGWHFSVRVGVLPSRAIDCSITAPLSDQGNSGTGPFKKAAPQAQNPKPPVSHDMFVKRLVLKSTASIALQKQIDNAPSAI